MKKFLFVLSVFFLCLGGFFSSLCQAEGLPAADQGGNARFVRLALNKSMVIALPEPAHDVLVGNAAIVDAVVRTKTSTYLFAKSLGQTNVFIFDEAGRQIANLDVEVSIDGLALQKLLNRSVSGGRVKVDTVGSNVVLSGVVQDASEARKAFDLAAQFLGDGDASKKIVNNMTIAGKDQVMLRVRIAEVQRTVLKQLGVDLQTALSKGSFAVSMLTGNPFTLNGALSDAAGPLLGASVTRPGAQIDAILQAYERDGLMRTLAEPTLSAISGESAKFLAGGEFPIPVSQDNNSISVEFKPFGVGLGFTPVVLSEGRISLRISSEVSELSIENSIQVGGLTLPGLRVRRAETTVELPSGGSMAMAGLIQERTRQEINGTPGAKDIPILGALFRSRDFQSNETELVVIVTPFIVSAVNENQLSTPLEKLVTPSDRETILFGRLNKVYGKEDIRDRPRGVYRGRVGHIID